MKSLDSRILAIMACLLWASAFLGVKTGLNYLPPLLFAGIRFLGAGLAVALVYGKKDTLKQIRTHISIILLTAFFQTFLLYSFFYSSLSIMRASTGAIVNGLGPLAVALAAHFMLPANHLGFRRLLCLLLGVAGIVLCSARGIMDTPGGSSSELPGILLMLMGVLSSALASVVVSRSPDDLDPFILNASQLIFGGAGLLSLSLIMGDRPYSGIPGLPFWIALFWLMMVTGGGFSLWYYLIKIRKEPLSEIAVWRFLIPLGGAVISWVFIPSDNPDVFSILGMALTSLAIFLFYRTAPACSTIAA